MIYYSFSYGKKKHTSNAEKNLKFNFNNKIALVNRDLIELNWKKNGENDSSSTLLDYLGYHLQNRVEEGDDDYDN